MTKCSICGESLGSLNLYITHYKSHSTGLNKVQIPCIVCNIPFTKKSAFYRHYATHAIQKKEPKLNKQTPEEKVLVCSHCQEVYENIYDFKKHAYQVYPEGNKIDCPICEKRQFDNFKVFEIHLYRFHRYNAL